MNRDMNRDMNREFMKIILEIDEEAKRGYSVLKPLSGGSIRAVICIF